MASKEDLTLCFAECIPGRLDRSGKVQVLLEKKLAPPFCFQGSCPVLRHYVRSTWIADIRAFDKCLAYEDLLPKEVDWLAGIDHFLEAPHELGVDAHVRGEHRH